MKKLFIILINIIIFTGLFFLTDFGIYKHHTTIFYKDRSKISPINKFKYMPYHPLYMEKLSGYFDGENNIYKGRAPVGEKYKNKPSIVIFGCSFAYGQYLNANQTFDYKLYQLTKRPVYNRAVSGTSFPLMYFQSTSDALYDEVKNPKDIIYVMIGHHYIRSMLYYFDILDIYDMIHYHVKNNKLILDNYDNKFLTFIKSTYLAKYINHIYIYKYVNNVKNKDKIINLTLLYFLESRKEMEKRWNKKLNFSIIFYNNFEIPYKKELTQRLEEEGFKVISTEDLTKENLNSKEYLMQDNLHPTEKAWDLLTPIIIKKLNL